MAAGFTPQIWVSNSSISDFLKCPRAYYLRNVYKDPRTGHKINLINPNLALGQTVHNVLESLSSLKAEDRFNNDLLELFEREWLTISGEKGGFKDLAQEQIFKERGKQMIQRVMDHPGPILNKALKLKSPDSLPPRFYISEEHNILLCGRIDWLEYLPEDDSVHIIDFKTGKSDDHDSLQLLIYGLLVKHCQERNVSKISYWYIDRDDIPTEMPLPDLDEAYKKVLAIALQVKALRESRNYVCKRGGCFACLELEAIVKGNAKFIGSSDYQDIYIIKQID